MINSPLQGIGNNILIEPTPNENGYITVTFTLSSEGCHDSQISKTIWVGLPEFSLMLDGFGNEIIELCAGEMLELFILSESPLNISDIQWNFSGSISGFGHSIKGRIRTTRKGQGYACATISNECGSIEKCIEINVIDCGWGKGLNNKGNNQNVTIFPNPVLNSVNLKFAFDGYKSINIYDSKGNNIISFQTYNMNEEIDLSNYFQGVYYVVCKTNEQTYYNKIIKL